MWHVCPPGSNVSRGKIPACVETLTSIQMEYDMNIQGNTMGAETWRYLHAGQADSSGASILLDTFGGGKTDATGQWTVRVKPHVFDLKNGTVKTSMRALATPGARQYKGQAWRCKRGSSKHTKHICNMHAGPSVTGKEYVKVRPEAGQLALLTWFRLSLSPTRQEHAASPAVRAGNYTPARMAATGFFQFEPTGVTSWSEHSCI
jgi:hypothetical protein